MVTIKRIILLSPFVIPMRLVVDTCSEVHIAGRGKPAAGHRSAEPSTPCLRSRGDPASSTAVCFGVGGGGWLPKTEAAPAPWAGAGGIWCAAGTEQADGDQKKEEKPSAKLLDPYRELFSSIPISPAKPKGVERLLARDLGLTVSPEFCKPSPLL